MQRQIRRIRRSGSLMAGVSVAVAGSLAEPGRTTRASIRTRQTVVQGRARATADDPDTKEASR